MHLVQKKEKQVLRWDGLFAGIPLQHGFVFFHSFQMSKEKITPELLKINDIVNEFVQESV